MIKRGNRNILINKRGDGIVGLSFSTIFSIFLIMTFLGFAIYVITQFLIPFLNCSKVGIFGEDLQEKITNAWQTSDFADTNFSGNIPSSIKQVCFANLSRPFNGNDANKKIGDELKQRFENQKANMFFYPIGKGCDSLLYKNIEHINVSRIISSKNPYCIAVKGGKISLRILKDSNLVLIK
jgi:hypothetical protein